MTRETVAGPFTGHTDMVTSVAFSPDGQYIALGSVDRTVRVSKLIIEKTETTIGVDFADHEVIDDEGWICDRDGKLEGTFTLSTYYLDFWQPWNNLSNFVHGHSWATSLLYYK